MPKKLLYFIIFLLVALLFLVMNKEETCTITFFPSIIKSIPKFEKSVPVVSGLIVAFLLGVLVMAPFSLFRPKKRDSKPGKHGGKSSGSE